MSFSERWLSLSLSNKTPARPHVAVASPRHERAPARAPAPRPSDIVATPIDAVVVETDVPAADTGSHAGRILAGAVSRARNTGSYLDIERLDAPASHLTFLLAPPHARGGYGSVAYAMGAHGERYAAKSVFTAASPEQAWIGVQVTSEARAQREVGIAQHVDEAIGSVAAVRTPGRLVHVMQLMDGSWSGLCADAQSMSLTLGVEGFLRSARSLASFHKSGVLHGDVKLDNLFWNRRGIIKWGDYGVSEVVPDARLLQGRRGTPFAMAPEVGSRAGFGLASDMWSFGVALGEMFVGPQRSPFRAGYDHLGLQICQAAIVDDAGKLNAGRLLAGTSDMHQFLAQWYRTCPTSCRFAVEELFVRNPEHRATSTRAVSVAKKIVAATPGHAKQAKRAMSLLRVPAEPREAYFNMLRDAWKTAVG